MSKNIPKKLNVCPIQESILEIRFSTEYPDDAIFGMVYYKVKELFPNEKIEQLPVQNIPEQIRKLDPNFKYLANQRIVKDNLSFSVGPRSIVFGNHKNYVGWDSWSLFFNKIIEKINETDLLSNVERIGLRYVNLFEVNIFNHVNIELLINSNKILNETTNIRTELNVGRLIQILQIGNAVNVTSNNTTKKASIIDIDCIFNFDKEENFREYPKILDDLHLKEKELFFRILKDNFIEKLEPEYLKKEK